jgi:hypothetical protein
LAGPTYELLTARPGPHRAPAERGEGVKGTLPLWSPYELQHCGGSSSWLPSSIHSHEQKVHFDFEVKSFSQEVFKLWRVYFIFETACNEIVEDQKNVIFKINLNPILWMFTHEIHYVCPECIQLSKHNATSFVEDVVIVGWPDEWPDEHLPLPSLFQLTQK